MAENSFANSRTRVPSNDIVTLGSGPAYRGTGCIKGYTAVLPQRLGAGLRIYVELIIDRTNPEFLESFRSVVDTFDEMTECHMVVGGFADLIKTHLADMEAYRILLGEALSGHRRSEGETARRRARISGFEKLHHDIGLSDRRDTGLTNEVRC